jgi:hypothetical protein
LNQAVKRNVDRFPSDFLMRLTRAELDVLNRSQFVTGSQMHRDPRFPPFAFTEHGATIAAILSAIRELMKTPEPKRRAIGFTADVESTE